MSHVENCIIKRMLAAFPPPTHLRGRPEAIEMTLETYRRGLAHFDRETLDEAWLRVCQGHRFWNWPMLSEIVKVAEAIRPRSKADDWVEKATGMADSYTRRFMKTSAVAARAREGGYESELRQYVTEVSWVQSQYLVGRHDIAYRSTTLFGREKPDDEFFAKAREQTETGSIRVRVPLALVERWREGAGKSWNCRPEAPLWDKNPEVYAISFRLHRQNIDQFIAGRP